MSEKKHKNLLLEVAVFNIESALVAEKSGADRVELCENPFDGGTTPSYGTIQLAKEKLNIPFFPIIRPRGGDFFYSNIEFDVIKRDVELCKSLELSGIVTGFLTRDAAIDYERLAKLVEFAFPMEITFHRAFDRVKDPLLAMETIIRAGCKRILTSGLVPKAIDNLPLISDLIKKAGDRIIIMPGSGIRSENISEILQETKAKEFHSSARTNKSSPMNFINDSMQETLENVSVDAAEIKRMRDKLSANSLT